MLFRYILCNVRCIRLVEVVIIVGDLTGNIGTDSVVFLKCILVEELVAKKTNIGLLMFMILSLVGTDFFLLITFSTVLPLYLGSPMVMFTT